MDEARRLVKTIEVEFQLHRGLMNIELLLLYFVKAGDGRVRAGVTARDLEVMTPTLEPSRADGSIN